MSHLFGFAHKFDAFRRVFFLPSIFSSIYANWPIDKVKAAHASVCLCAEQCCQIVSENIDISTTENGKRQFCSRKNVQLLLSKTFIDRCRRRRTSKIFLYIHQQKFAQIKLWMKFTTFFSSFIPSFPFKTLSFFSTKTSARVEFEKFVRFLFYFHFLSRFFVLFFFLLFSTVAFRYKPEREKCCV